MLFPIVTLTSTSSYQRDGAFIEAADSTAAIYPFKPQLIRRFGDRAQIRSHLGAQLHSNPIMDVFVACADDSPWITSGTVVPRWPTKIAADLAQDSFQLKSNYAIIRSLTVDGATDLKFLQETSGSLVKGGEYLIMQARHNLIKDRLIGSGVRIKFSTVDSRTFSPFVTVGNASSYVQELVTVGGAAVHDKIRNLKVDGCDVSLLVSSKIGQRPEPYGFVIPSRGLIVSRLSAAIFITGTSQATSIHQAIVDPGLSFPAHGSYFSASSGPKNVNSMFSGSIHAMASGTAGDIAEAFTRDIKSIRFQRQHDRCVYDFRLTLPGNSFTYSQNPTAWDTGSTACQPGQVGRRQTFTLENLNGSTVGDTPFITTLAETGLQLADPNSIANTASVQMKAPWTAISKIGLFDKFGELYGIASFGKSMSVAYQYDTSLDRIQPVFSGSWFGTSSHIVARMTL
tara:strand:- start:4041 stop:5405 length:1365 start_codon:yes stop_codon:yes gene_type:complete